MSIWYAIVLHLRQPLTKHRGAFAFALPDNPICYLQKAEKRSGKKMQRKVKGVINLDIVSPLPKTHTGPVWNFLFFFFSCPGKNIRVNSIFLIFSYLWNAIFFYQILVYDVFKFVLRGNWMCSFWIINPANFSMYSVYLLKLTCNRWNLHNRITDFKAVKSLSTPVKHFPLLFHFEEGKQGSDCV